MGDADIGGAARKRSTDPGVETLAPRLRVYREAMVRRRVGTLAAIGPRTDWHPTRWYDQIRILQVHAVRIDHLGGVADMAAETDREVPARRVVAVAALGDGSGDAEVAAAFCLGRHVNLDPWRHEELDPLDNERGGSRWI